MTTCTTNLLSVLPGTKCPWLILDAPHAAEPRADAFTGPITEAAARIAGATAIISQVSREIADLNRPYGFKGNEAAVAEYRDALGSVLAESGLLDNSDQLCRPVLHLCIHGMKDRVDYPYAIEVGSAPYYGPGESCSPAVRDSVYAAANAFGQTTIDLPASLNECFYGDASLLVHRLGDPQYPDRWPGWGANYHCLQLEFNRTLREHYAEEVAEFLARLAEAFAEDFS